MLIFQILFYIDRIAHINNIHNMIPYFLVNHLEWLSADPLKQPKYTHTYTHWQLNCIISCRPTPTIYCSYAIYISIMPSLYIYVRCLYSWTWVVVDTLCESAFISIENHVCLRCLEWIEITLFRLINPHNINVSGRIWGGGGGDGSDWGNSCRILV